VLLRIKQFDFGGESRGRDGGDLSHRFPAVVSARPPPGRGALPHVAPARGEQGHRLGDVFLEMRGLLVRIERLLVTYTS